MASKKLTKKQQIFVLEYIKYFSATEAYKRAFPKSNPKYAKQYAFKLIHLPHIQEAIDEAVREAIGPKEKDLKQNIQFWIDMRDDPNEKSANRLKASEYLSKYRGLFTDKVEHSGEVAVNIVDDI